MVGGIVVEVVERGVGVKDVGVESRQWLVESRGRFRVRVVYQHQPRASQHPGGRRSETTAGTSIHLSSCQSRGLCRVSSVHQGKWAIPAGLSQVEWS